MLVLQAKDKGGLLYCKPPVFNVVLAIDAVCRTFMVPAMRIHAGTYAEMRSALELSTALRQRWAEALYAVGVSDEVHGEGTTELLYTLFCERWLHMRQRQMRLLYVQGKLAAAERQADALRTARKGDRGGRDKDGQMGKGLVKLIRSLAPAAAHTALQGVLAAEPAALAGSTRAALQSHRHHLSDFNIDLVNFGGALSQPTMRCPTATASSLFAGMLTLSSKSVAYAAQSRATGGQFMDLEPCLWCGLH